MISLTIDENNDLRPLYSLIANMIPYAPPGYITKQIGSGAVSVNSETTLPFRTLRTGDVITIKETFRFNAAIKRGTSPLDLLYENDEIVIVNKPPGIAMHKTDREETTLIDIADQFFRSRESEIHSRPVNRLDRGTSGAVILAKGGKAAGIYGRNLKEDGFEKIYCAICSGKLEREGEIVTPIDGKEAITAYKSLAVSEKKSFVLLKPVTGRTHQLRIHLCEAGHSIIGDQRYGGPKAYNYDGFYLHSLMTRISLADRKSISISAPLPIEFRKNALSISTLSLSKLFDEINKRGK